ncbi:TIGR00730 family Rossman fold protein [Paludibacter sp. 221]|uniref:LOG family protein n=1 Tax=Paludibacter sp. 221 TaxID=2302939 RepID=UPI0013CFBA76|nr:TIGR00730 family Rossman fold protein [Paludibacter sp. 221]NDV46495.1 TIGR00730 family Rossman fold protein [Paludibacter sp. 221]
MNANTDNQSHSADLPLGEGRRGLNLEGFGVNVCVFCSSSNNIAEAYKQSAFRLGELIAGSGNTLVYGGADGGLMSAVAGGASSKGGDIIGVIAEPIVRMNRQSKFPTQFITVKDLSERKRKMKEIADLFVVLPGGYGTLDEMFDVLASGLVGEHDIPLYLINEDGFFDCLLNEIDVMKAEKCIAENISYNFYVLDSAESFSVLSDL